MCWHHTVRACVVKTRLAPSYRGGKIYIILSFCSCSSQTQKNGGNLVTLATGRAYVLRKAADGGGRRGKGRHRDGDKELKKKINRKAMAHFSHHTHTGLTGCTVQQKWVLVPVLCSKKNDPSFPLSAHAICQTDLLHFFHLLDTRRLFKHNLFPQASPWEWYPTFTPLFFFFSFFSSLWLFFIYLQLDACSSIDYFTKDMSGLCLSCAGLYI